MRTLKFCCNGSARWANYFSSAADFVVWSWVPLSKTVLSSGWVSASHLLRCGASISKCGTELHSLLERCLALLWSLTACGHLGTQAQHLYLPSRLRSLITGQHRASRTPTLCVPPAPSPPVPLSLPLPLPSLPPLPPLQHTGFWGLRPHGNRSKGLRRTAK